MKCFIVGTDTGVGKTHYGKDLAQKGHRVIKPIETGKSTFDNLDFSDCYSYSNIQNIPLSSVNLYFFSQPLSPHEASAIDKTPIDLKALKSFINKDDTFIELAGGLMVPLTNSYTQFDLICETPHASVDLVVGNALGCINHSLMSLHILKQAGIFLRTIVMNSGGRPLDFCMKSNIETIKQWAPREANIICL